MIVAPIRLRRPEDYWLDKEIGMAAWTIAHNCVLHATHMAAGAHTLGSMLELRPVDYAYDMLWSWR